MEGMRACIHFYDWNALDARSVIRSHHAIFHPAGIPRLRFHDLRHSAATLLLAQGVSPKYISQMLGHTQVAFTMQTYAHVIQGSAAAGQLTRWTPYLKNPVAPSSGSPQDICHHPLTELSWFEIYGAPGTTRTCDLLVRSQTLYPTELRALIISDLAAPAR